VAEWVFCAFFRGGGGGGVGPPKTDKTAVLTSFPWRTGFFGGPGQVLPKLDKTAVFVRFTGRTGGSFSIEGGPP